MAVSIVFVCCKCRQHKQELGDPSEAPATGRVCAECREIERGQEKEAFLKKRAALPSEERLALLEADLYDLKELVQSHFQLLDRRTIGMVRLG